MEKEEIEKIKKIYEMGTSAEAFLICKFAQALESSQREAADLREMNTGLVNMLKHVLSLTDIQERREAIEHALARTEKAAK